MYIAILGRQPALGLAELERLHGAEALRRFSDVSAIIDVDEFDFNRLGGSQKAGRVILDLSSGNWRDISQRIIEHYTESWSNVDHKITLGISVYGLPTSARDVQGLGLALKKRTKSAGGSLRLIPNADPALNTATSHHNKLGLSEFKIELLIVRAPNGRTVVAESIGAQNITALAARDQARPKTDAFVGMLPPKLARMIVNLAIGSKNNLADEKRPFVLDPFCGTGVILQEALLLGYSAYGSDHSEKMVDYSAKNLEWLRAKWSLDGESRLELADAMRHQWLPPVDAVACETYLGQPFSAPPSPEKLREVRGNCDHIISSFLENIARQLAPGTPLCLAIPAWRGRDGRFTHLPLIDRIEELGYQRISLKSVQHRDLLYYRENQVVARELLLLTKA